MTYRERKEARIARRLVWAESRKRKAAARFAGAHRIMDNIPLGQPILVGHHSERHARKDQERIDNGIRAGFESQAMAKRHISVAGGIQDQLDTSIYRDDADGAQRMRERLASLETERERIKAYNASARKAKGTHGDLNLLTENEKRVLLSCIQFQPYACKYGQFPAYHLANLSGNIARNRARLGELERREADTRRVHEVLAEEAQPSGEKEPWEMTNTELAATPPAYGKGEAWNKYHRALVAATPHRQVHKSLVQQAIVDCKPVPTEVLAEILD